MNDGDSAGGGHEGLSPAPPAVPDRVKFQQQIDSKTTQKLTGLITTKATEVPTTTQTTLLQRRVANFSSSSTSSLGHFTAKTETIDTTKVVPIVPLLSLTTETLPNQRQTTSSFQTASLPMQQTTLIEKQSSTAGAAEICENEEQQDFESISNRNQDSEQLSSAPLAKRQRLDLTTNEASVVGGTSSNTVIGSLLPAAVASPITDQAQTGSSSTAPGVVPIDNFHELKKRVHERKHSKLHNVKERFSQNVAEYYYLHIGGSMMEYPAWRKKSPTPQFVSYSNVNRLDQLVAKDKASSISNSSTYGLPGLPPTQSQKETIGNVANSAQTPLTDAVKTTHTESQQPTKVVCTTNNSSSSTTTSIAERATPQANNNKPSASVTISEISSVNILPEDAEIKIPAVGATPVAVSTKLPAAVVQLSQQGQIPGRPLGGRHGMVFGQISVPPAVGNSSVPLVPGGTPLVPCSTAVGTTTLWRTDKGSQNVTTSSPVVPPTHYSSAGSSNSGLLIGGPAANGSAVCSPSQSIINPENSTLSSAQEFSFKAKQEVYVMQRVSELQREGLWTEKRLPKLQEPSRPKAHWDYLLEEMVWLAADFAQERKWKKNAAKKCAKMVQKYFQDKANAAQKAEKAQELHLKRIAAFISKEVKMFWSNVEKLVEYKHHTKIEEKRKKALDQHLSFIVDQTEKFSQQLAEGMNKNVGGEVSSINSSRLPSPKRDDDVEFRPETGSEDDEETIAKAEEEATDVNEEVKALEKESQMDFDDFLKELPDGYLENRDKIIIEKPGSSPGHVSDDSDDSEFEAKGESEDDENTIMKQEEEEMELDHKKEIDELEADNDLTVEQLLNKYKSGNINDNESPSTKLEKPKSESEPDEKLTHTAALDSDDDSSLIESNEETDEDEETSTSMETENEEETADKEEDDGLKSLVEDLDVNKKDDMIKDAAALAESLQPKGNTLSSTNVVTPVPFLLKHSLREYQHIGLDWLVTMNERKLNGILADEMGLGKTIQTIALLAHLACAKECWGPHLIVVPSSVMLNWEMEFKKWCPAFKILTYYGTQKERKLKRVGWTKPNAFHVCITSYKLVVQDQQSFRRKKWKYLILDEAQNIKNFKSQRWQLLLNFSTERRLLLTGTPLQNDLMELWSLMHFLMPYVFSSHREFKEWFSNPMTGMIEGNMEYNETLIGRLHKVIRPFLLRRLKKEVEKQMPKKYEHVVMCRLSNRQRYLYDDFMSRAKTKETLQTGNLLSVINVLMQLRKVCNHPNMFEVRPTISPFQMEGITVHTPRIVCDINEYDPFTQIDIRTLNLLLVELELVISAYVSYKCRMLAPTRKIIEEIDCGPEPGPHCPSGQVRFFIRVRDQQVANQIHTHNHNSLNVRVGASPAMKIEGNKFIHIRPIDINNSRILKRFSNSINPINMQKRQILSAVAVSSSSPLTTSTSGITTTLTTRSQFSGPTPAKITKTIQDGKPFFYLTSTNEKRPSGGARLTLTSKSTASAFGKPLNKLNENKRIVNVLAQEVKSTTAKQTKAGAEKTSGDDEADETGSIADPIYNMEAILEKRKVDRLARLKTMSSINRRRTESTPIYGEDCRYAIEKCIEATRSLDFSTWQTRGYTNCLTAMESHNKTWSLHKILKTYEQRCLDFEPLFANYVLYVPAVCAPRIRFYVQHLNSKQVQCDNEFETKFTHEISPKLELLHPVITAMTTQFPDPRLIQYDCGKLQTLDKLLRQLKTEGHRVLIFTQMTKMLDVLEAFLNFHGHIYLRLDGSTRVEQRQILMERFNADKRIFCFILSTRSGGVGVNLTGADTVIFYDSDWNPTMDAQAQDRCHRIGQTRDVHIYRLVSEKTIEVNILKKANQKRMLSDMAIEGGNFTTTYFKSSTIKDLFTLDNNDQNTVVVQDGQLDKQPVTAVASATTSSDNTESSVDTEKQSLRAYETALAAAEDEQDVQATKTAKAEVAADLAEFDETIPIDESAQEGIGGGGTTLEMSRADLEMKNLVSQLSPIERYAMRFVEETGAAWTAEQLRAAEEELEAQKREWEANRLAAMQKEEEFLKKEAEAEEIMTYSRKDANNQIWISRNTMEKMPMWCPPTPPQDENDVYIDYSLSFMYEMEPISESELPPVYVRKENKRTRSEAGFGYDNHRRPNKMRREDNYVAPRSLFDRPSVALARLRRDLKNQRYRGVFKPNIQIPCLKPQLPMKTVTEPESMAEWGIFEDIAILHVLVNVQGLPCNLMLLSPGHTPNWDLISEIVNFHSKTYRSARQCRWRYETHIQPREEGKLVESPKKQKKLKPTLKNEYLKSPLRCLRTTQLYANDNNASFFKVMRSRFDCIKTAYLKKAPAPKRIFSAPNSMNPKHMEVLQGFGILNYDQAISPMNTALLRATKARDNKQTRQQLGPPFPPPIVSVTTNAQQHQQQTSQSNGGQQVNLPQQAAAVLQQQQQQAQVEIITQQAPQAQPSTVSIASSPLSTGNNSSLQHIQIQHISNSNVVTASGLSQSPQQQQPTAIVLHHASAANMTQKSSQQSQLTTNVTSVGGSVGQPQIMRTHHMSQSANQILKTIVGSQTAGIITAGHMQQLAQQSSGGTVQLQSSNSSSSVSVVLTTPVQSLPSVVQAAQQQHSTMSSNNSGQISSTAQIVSISPQTLSSNASPQVGSIVQTQPLPQVVPVSQLPTVGTVLTTSSSLQQSGVPVTTLNTSSLRGQRIVTASPGTLQDVLQQRSGNSNPTIVSMSSLGQNVSPAQFQTAQLRLATVPGNGQQPQLVTKVPVSALHQNRNNLTTTGNQQTAAQLQFYRQRQLKVLQTPQSSPSMTTTQNPTVMQTAGGLATGTIIQTGNIMQPSNTHVSGQKVTVANLSGSQQVVTSGTPGGIVTSVGSVQVTHAQARSQFIKQMAANKQGLARQVVTDGSVNTGADVLLVKRHPILTTQKGQMLQQGQIFTTTTNTGATTLQQQQTHLPVGSIGTAGNQQQTTQQVTPQQIATMVKASTAGGATSGISSSGVTSGGITVATAQQGGQGTVNVPLSQLKPGSQIKVTMANQMRQLHMQQQLPRKISRMTQLVTSTGQPTGTNIVGTAQGQQQGSGGVTVAQASNIQAQQQQKGATGGNVPAQLVHIQNTKSLPSSVTVQQIQQVMRQGQQGATLAATGLVLGKTSVGRVLPVSVASQSNPRQTIQVVSAASAQALAAGNLRAHVASGQNIAGTIKVATTGTNQNQTTQQALITAIQQQAAAQQSQRQNASPVRLQTTAGGSLVAVVQQQQNTATGSSSDSIMTVTQTNTPPGTTISNQQQQNQLQQQQQQQHQMPQQTTTQQP